MISSSPLAAASNEETRLVKLRLPLPGDSRKLLSNMLHFPLALKYVHLEQHDNPLYESQVARAR